MGAYTTLVWLMADWGGTCVPMDASQTTTSKFRVSTRAHAAVPMVSDIGAYGSLLPSRGRAIDHYAVPCVRTAAAAPEGVTACVVATGAPITVDVASSNPVLLPTTPDDVRQWMLSHNETAVFTPGWPGGVRVQMLWILNADVRPQSVCSNDISWNCECTERAGMATCRTSPFVDRRKPCYGSDIMGAVDFNGVAVMCAMAVLLAVSHVVYSTRSGRVMAVSVGANLAAASLVTQLPLAVRSGLNPDLVPIVLLCVHVGALTVLCTGYTPVIRRAMVAWSVAMAVALAADTTSPGLWIGAGIAFGAMSAYGTASLYHESTGSDDSTAVVVGGGVATLLSAAVAAAGIDIDGIRPAHMFWTTAIAAVVALIVDCTTIGRSAPDAITVPIAIDDTGEPGPTDIIELDNDEAHYAEDLDRGSKAPPAVAIGIVVFVGTALPSAWPFVLGSTKYAYAAIGTALADTVGRWYHPHQLISLSLPLTVLSFWATCVVVAAVPSDAADSVYIGIAMAAAASRGSMVSSAANAATTASHRRELMLAVVAGMVIGGMAGLSALALAA